MDVHSKFRICSISCKCPPRACGSAWHFLLLILTYVYPDSDARTGTNIHVHSIASSCSPTPTVPPNAGDPTLRRSLPPRHSFRLALIEHNRRGLHGQPLVPFHYTLRIQYVARFSMHNSVPSNPLPPQPLQSRGVPVPHILTPLQQGLRFAHGPPSNRIAIGKTLTIGPSLRGRLLHLRPRPSWCRAGPIEALSSYLHGSKAEHRRLKLPVRTPTIHSLRMSSSPQGPRPPPLHRVHPNPDPRITMDARGKTSRRV